MLLSAGAHAGIATSPNVTSNGPWTVGQQGAGGIANASYTITFNHTRVGSSSSNNAVTITSLLPQGIWPSWTTQTTFNSYVCQTPTFNNASKRYSISCRRSDVPNNGQSLTLPLWIDQLAVGTASLFSVTATPGSGIAVTNPAANSPAVNSIAQVPLQSCTANGGSLAANRFALNGSFGSIGSNTVGNTGGAFSSTTAVNSTSSLVSGTTSMGYFTGDLADGQYRVSNRLSKRPDLRDSNWFWTVGDHTSIGTNGGKGDPNQLMMAMNANNTPGDFYTETLAVTAYRTYQFSIWAIHANNPISDFFSGGNQPLPYNIDLAVNRIGIDDDNDGTIDEAGEAQVVSTSSNVSASNAPTWRQFGGLFNPGSATQVQFIFRNNGPGGGGNDLAIDDMLLAECAGLPSGNLQGTLYYDDDRDNSLDGVESGRLPTGVSVELRNSSNIVVATAETDANGQYLFQNIPVLPNGNYMVRVVATDTDIPAGAVLGTSNNVNVTLTNGSIQTVNFGFDAIRLTLRKQWANAAVNDAVTIAASSGGATLRSFGTVANAANELDVDTISTNLGVGSTVTFAEAFTTGNASQYQSQLACTGSTDTDPSNGVLVAAADSNIVCTYTNTRLSADLAITKTNGVGQVMAGGSTIYTIRVTNNGSDAATGAVLSDPAVAGLAKTAVACSPSPGQCTAGTTPTVAQLEAGHVLPTLASGQFYEITVTASVSATGQ